MLSRSREVHASDGRDRVFGLLGLMFPDSNIPELLRPDYDKSLAHVYRDAMRYCIEVEDDSRAFARIFHKDESELDAENWLTWVPRFQLLWAEQMANPSLRDIYNDRYRHSGNEAAAEASQLTTSVPDVLVLSGINIDSLARISCSLDIRYWLPHGEFEDVRRYLDEATTLCQGHDPLQLARTLIAGVSISYKRSSTRDEEGLQVLKGFMNTRKYRHLKALEQSDPGSNEPEMRASCYYYAMLAASRGRRIAATAAGHLSLVPRICQDGDIIAVMNNCSKPLALRPKGSVYQMLGECYLDGFMWEDERVRLEQKGKRREETFRIR